MKRRDSHIFEKEEHGHYVEPEWCSRRLFEVEKFKGAIYDPACGWGRILHAAKAAGYQVQGSDIVDRRHHGLNSQFHRRDFLFRQEDISGSVVSNPPFDHVEEFCQRALDLGATRVAMICLTRRLNAAHWLENLPLRRIWLLTPRPSMPPGSWIAAGNKPGGGKQDFCWLVFGAGIGSPTVHWLHRDT
jgi:hypothetical protein